jgi:hypothetical protein
MDNTRLNPKLTYVAAEFDTHFKVYHELMSNKVLDILLVASAYDAYILEEDASLASKIINEYHGLNLSRPPRLTRVDGAQRALDTLKDQHFDMVITMPHLEDMDPFELGRSIKAVAGQIPVILLAHSVQGIFPLPTNKDCSGIDQIFIWSGDADLLLAIVKSVEDRRNVESDTQKAQVRVIILVEDSPLYRSFFLPLIYREVVRQTQEVLDESLNEEHRLLKMRARPKILVAENYETAIDLFQRFKPYLFGVMADTRFPRNGKLSADAGVAFLARIKQEIPDMPLLLLSNESSNRAKADQLGVQFLDKNSPRLFEQLHTYFLEHLGFGDFVFRLIDGKEVGRASNLRELEALLPAVPDEPLCYHAARNRFSNWIMARSEIALATRMRHVQVSDFTDTSALRHYLVDSIHGLRKWRQKGVVAQFNAKEFDSQIADIVKIGHGSLGGKARGIAFAANLLRQSPHLYEKYGGIDIGIPPSLVITSEGFEAFIAANALPDPLHHDLRDEQIAAAFAAAHMPEAIVNDLIAYLETVRYPLSVRSSSLLEDAQHQTLAGLYHTFMIPNNAADPAIRLIQLIDAIKQVYASTWFELPRRFVRSTAYRHRKEIMAVMVQKICGSRYGDYFYPALSGVARSQNHYPVAPIQPDDGMAKIALGFGRIITRGEGGLHFCPKYPHLLPDFSKVEDILANAQQTFYALSLANTETRFDLSKDLEQRKVADAVNEPALVRVVSTYQSQDGRIRDSATAPGNKIVTFAPILKHKIFPLADLLTDLLAIGRKGTGCHVEIEFGIDFPEEESALPTFNLLQMRPMSMGGNPFEVQVTDDDRRRALCFSYKALGHGRFDHVADIVYVKPDAFDTAATRTIAAEISRINAGLKADHRPYLLIGPGRWGSFDPWLGIPVKWEDINGAGAIVELRNAALKADPSYGSHFFQHITTHGLTYLTITEKGDDRMDWPRVLQMPAIQETDHLRHVRLPAPLLIKCDGRTSQCAILTATKMRAIKNS